jgi:D-alanyl-D-alanine dipeptidase
MPISISDLVPMDLFAGEFPVRVDLVYGDAAHPENIFREAVYRPGARLWLHRGLAETTLLAALRLRRLRGWVLLLKDGLRTVEAQALMGETAVSKANPHWFEGPVRLLSPPGKGAHPRALAVDVVPDGADMGTVFDHLSSDPACNPAARSFKELPPEALDNRAALEEAFVSAAAIVGHPLLPLPQEWWDFRLPAEEYERHAPLSDADLPPMMRMTGEGASGPAPHEAALADEIRKRVTGRNF